MKKMLATLLLAALLCAPALAETDDAELNAAAIPRDTPVSMDLDGDGTEETVSWTMAAADEYTSLLELTVADGDGAISCRTEYCSAEAAFAADLDGDGVVELLLTGDYASDDYGTTCLHFVHNRLEKLQFADGNRGENSGERQDEGYGMLVGIKGNAVTLSGSQDVLGTWFAHRTYALADGWFDFADGGEWVRDIEIDELDDTFWEESYSVLTTRVPLAYTGEDGAAAELPAGAKLLICASDKASYARFIARDGAAGTLAIAPDTDRGWGMLVNGMGEEDCFEFIPYAD